MPTVSIHAAHDPLVLALDMGTSSFRALLFDSRGYAVETSETQIAFDLTTTHDGGAEANAIMLLDLLAECIDGTLEKAASAANRIAAVGATSFWHGILGLDANGTPLTPHYFWADTRAGDAALALRGEIDREANRQRTGVVFHSSYWTAKLRWLATTQPTVVANVRRWTSFPDWVMQQLFGVDRTAVIMATGTGLLEIQTATWATDLVERLGIDPQTLPPLIDRHESASGLRAPWASRWPALKSIPWYPAGGDGASANVGTNAVSARRICLTLGTSGAIRMVIPHPVGTPLTLPPDLWAYRLDTTWIALGGAISNGGKTVAVLQELIGGDPDSGLLTRATALAPDSHGLTMLPFFAGERSPIWNDDATAAIIGFTLHTTREDLLLAGMEAVAYRLGLLYRNLSSLADHGHEIATSGAAVLKSPAWQRMIASVFDHPILPLPPEEESSARGAALLALESLGVIASIETAPDPAAGVAPVLPDPATVSVYAAAMARQFALESMLYPR